MFLLDIQSQGLSFGPFKKNLGNQNFISGMNGGKSTIARRTLDHKMLAVIENTLREYKEYFFGLMN